MTAGVDLVKEAQVELFDTLAALLAAVDKAANIDPNIDREVPSFIWRRSDGVTFTYTQTSMHEIHFELQVPADSIVSQKNGGPA